MKLRFHVDKASVSVQYVYAVSPTNRGQEFTVISNKFLSMAHCSLLQLLHQKMTRRVAFVTPNHSAMDVTGLKRIDYQTSFIYSLKR